MTEMLAVVTHDGSPTGRLRTRAEIHRKGDWHCTRSVWVVLMREARVVRLLSFNSGD